MNRSQMFMMLLLLGSVWSISGCHSVTEVGGLIQSSITLISTSDFSIVSTLQGIEDGRVICSVDNSLVFVYSSSGRLYRIDLDEMAIDTSFVIDTGSGQPAFGMTSPPPGSSLFVLGSGGQIIHVSIASNSVAGVFSPGPSTVALCSSHSASDTMIYTVDGQDNYVREIDPSSHSIIRSDVLWLTPSCITIALDGDSLLVGSEVDEAVAFVILNMGPMYARPPLDVSKAVNDVIAFPSEDEYYFASCPEWGSGSGSVVKIERPQAANRFGVDGHPVRLAADNPGHYLFVLSNTGSGSCLVTIIDEWFGGVVAEIPINGYPRDMVIHGDDEYLLVLTAG